MGEIGLLVLLYGLGIAVLVAEIFLPSHGLLTVLGLGLLIGAIARTFMDFGETAGLLSMLAVLVFLPTFAFISVKYWHRTPVGRWMSPPNPELTSGDTGVPIEQLRGLLGASGRAVSPLRPSGICEFNGRRLTCTTRMGLIETGSEVTATEIVNGTLCVIKAS